MSYAKPETIRTKNVASAVGGRIAVALTGNDLVAVANNATAPIYGITERIGSRENLRVDVITKGIAEALAGGTITAGAPVTAGTDGVLLGVADDVGVGRQTRIV